MYTMEDSQHCGKKKQSSPEKVSKKAAVERRKSTNRQLKQQVKHRSGTSKVHPAHPKSSEKKRIHHVPKKFPINTM